MENNIPGVSIEDIRFVPTVCEKCGLEGAAPTLRQYLENPESPISKMLEKDGHVKILCMNCAEVAVDAYKEKEAKEQDN